MQKANEEMRIYRKKQINKIYKGNVGKTRAINKSRVKSMGLGSHGIDGKFKGQHEVKKV